MKNIGIMIELDNGKIKDTTFGMITLLRQKDTELFALVMDADVKSLKKDLESYGVTKIVDIGLAKDLQNNPVVRAKAIIAAVKSYDISVITGLSTAEGKNLLPRVAALLEAPLAMDCFAVDIEKGLVKTLQYSGKTLATIKMTGSPWVLGVRPNSVEPLKASATADLLTVDGTGIAAEGLTVIKTGGGDKNTKASLVEADVIIAGGRGMKNGDNFNILFRCAEKLKAAVGASRVAVDSGWVPYAMQVGQTGEKVNPKVYIACGISGSIQHFAGMKTSGMVIAVNTDKNASIMSNCDYYVIADALEIIPELTKLLENS